jgi:hypothetical protein
VLEYNKTGDDLLYNHRLLLPDGSLKYIGRNRKRIIKMKRGEVIGIREPSRPKNVSRTNNNRKSKEINDVRSALDESSIVTITDHKGVLPL